MRLCDLEVIANKNKAKIDELDLKIDALEVLIEALTARLDALEG